MIRYFFATMSPWAYLGHARFVSLVERHGAGVEVLPCDFGKVFAATGGVPLPQRPVARQAYRLAELARWRDHLKLPLTIKPAHFPVDGAPAAIAIHACQSKHGQAKALALSGEVLAAVWAHEQNISDITVLAALCEKAGIHYADLDLAAGGAAYEQATQKALAAGVFGAPWFEVSGHGKTDGFWGQDRLDFVEGAMKAALG